MDLSFLMWKSDCLSVNVCMCVIKTLTVCAVHTSVCVFVSMYLHVYFWPCWRKRRPGLGSSAQRAQVTQTRWRSTAETVKPTTRPAAAASAASALHAGEDKIHTQQQCMHTDCHCWLFKYSRRCTRLQDNQAEQNWWELLWGGGECWSPVWGCDCSYLPSLFDIFVWPCVMMEQLASVKLSSGIHPASPFRPKQTTVCVCVCVCVFHLSKSKALKVFFS